MVFSLLPSRYLLIMKCSEPCCYCSVAESCQTLCDSFDCSTPSFSVLPYLPKFAQTDVHWVSDAIPTSHPLSPFSTCLQYFPALGSFAMSQLFTSGGQSIGASALASVLLIDWFDLLVVQGTLKSLLQHHSSKVTVVSTQTSLWSIQKSQAVIIRLREG